MTTNQLEAAHGLLGLSHCALNYAHALEAPFHFHGEACIPDLYAVPSKKVRAVMKYEFSTGVNGFGYFTSVMQDKCNNLTPIRWTDATFTGVNTFVITGAGVNTAQYTKLPYSSTAFAASTSDGIRGRVVALGLRIRDIGPSLYAGGKIIALRHPENRDMSGLTVDDILSYEESRTYPVTKDWTYLNYRPVRPEEYQYSENGPTDAGNLFGHMGFFITGTQNASGVGPRSFEAQVCVFMEYLGKIDNITRTHADVVGMSQIRNAAPVTSSTRNPGKQLYDTLVRVGQNSRKTEAPVIQQARHEMIRDAHRAGLPRLAYRGNDKGKSSVVPVHPQGFFSRMLAGAKSLGNSVMSGFKTAEKFITTAGPVLKFVTDVAELI